MVGTGSGFRNMVGTGSAFQNMVGTGSGFQNRFGTGSGFLAVFIDQSHKTYIISIILTFLSKEKVKDLLVY